MILDWIFPPLCIHCSSQTKSSKFPFCQTCFGTLEKICPQERCAWCFSEKEEGSPFCRNCRDYPLGLKGVAAVFEHFGTSSSLLKEWKICHRPDLAKGLAAWLALQFTELNWPIPELIVPIPQTLLRTMTLGFNPPYLLAQELGEIIDVPVHMLLKKKWGHPPQARLLWEHRKQLSYRAFEWKCKQDISDKTILLVDDVIGTGATLKAAALRLREGFPKAVYGLALCI
jgi:ComF family protein